MVVKQDKVKMLLYSVAIYTYLSVNGIPLTPLECNVSTSCACYNSNFNTCIKIVLIVLETYPSAATS